MRGQVHRGEEAKERIGLLLRVIFFTKSLFISWLFRSFYARTNDEEVTYNNSLHIYRCDNNKAKTSLSKNVYSNIGACVCVCLWVVCGSLEGKEKPVVVSDWRRMFYHASRGLCYTFKYIFLIPRGK